MLEPAENYIPSVPADQFGDCQILAVLHTQGDVLQGFLRHAELARLLQLGAVIHLPYALQDVNHQQHAQHAHRVSQRVGNHGFGRHLLH